MGARNSSENYIAFALGRGKYCIDFALAGRRAGSSGVGKQNGVAANLLTISANWCTRPGTRKFST